MGYRAKKGYPPGPQLSFQRVIDWLIGIDTAVQNTENDRRSTFCTEIPAFSGVVRKGGRGPEEDKAERPSKYSI